MNAFEKIGLQITELENENERLSEEAKKWRTRYYNIKSRLDNLEKNQISKSEFERVLLVNSKLQTELNRRKRHERAVKKLEKIEKVLKG